MQGQTTRINNENLFDGSPNSMMSKLAYPSSSQDYCETSLDLNEHLILDRTSTFIMRVDSDAMINLGIYNGDELIVDRSIQPKNSNIVIALLDNEFLIRSYYKINDKVELRAANSSVPIIKVASMSNFIVWGVVTRNIHKLL